MPPRTNTYRKQIFHDCETIYNSFETFSDDTKLSIQSSDSMDSRIRSKTFIDRSLKTRYDTKYDDISLLDESSPKTLTYKNEAIHCEQSQKNLKCLCMQCLDREDKDLFLRAGEVAKSTRSNRRSRSGDKIKFEWLSDDKLVLHSACVVKSSRRQHTTRKI